jgi:opacity protein-like surface antigen
MGCARKLALIGLCLSAQMGAQTTFAADQGFYFGLNAGQAKYDFKPIPRNELIIPVGTVPPFAAAGTPALNPASGYLPLLDTVFRTSSPVFARPIRAYWIPGKDDKATALGVFAGYRIFRYAAVELSYADLGSLHEYQPAINLTPTIRTLAVDSDLETSGPTISALGILPLTEQWEVYLRVGGIFAEQKVTHTTDFSHDETTYGADGFLFGAGTQYDFGSHWTVRLDYQRFDDVGDGNGLGEADIDVLSLGFPAFASVSLGCYVFGSASTFAAQMKSFSDRPLIECVVNFILQAP